MGKQLVTDLAASVNIFGPNGETWDCLWDKNQPPMPILVPHWDHSGVILAPAKIV